MQKENSLGQLICRRESFLSVVMRNLNNLRLGPLPILKTTGPGRDPAYVR